MIRKPIIVSGSNSQNGQGSPLPPTGGSGNGENQRNFRTNAYPPGSPSSPGTAQEIIAQFASGLRFIPDAFLYGTPKDFIQPFYFCGDEAKAKQTKVTLTGNLDTEGDDTEPLTLPICFSAPFRQKLFDRLTLGTVSNREIEIPSNTKLLAIISDPEISLLLNDSINPITSTTFVFSNYFGSISKLLISTTDTTEVKLYLFA